MMRHQRFQDEPCFAISVVARMIGVHAQTLRHYERAGLIRPSRTMGRQRLYSAADVERIRRLRTLIDDLGVNLAGAEVAPETDGPHRGTGGRSGRPHRHRNPPAPAPRPTQLKPQPAQ